MEPEGSILHSHVPITCPVLSQGGPIHAPTSHFLKIHRNIILSSKPGTSQSPLSLRFSHQNPEPNTVHLQQLYTYIMLYVRITSSQQLNKYHSGALSGAVYYHVYIGTYMVICINRHHAPHYMDQTVYCGYYRTESVHTFWFQILNLFWWSHWRSFFMVFIFVIIIQL